MRHCQCSIAVSQATVSTLLRAIVTPPVALPQSGRSDLTDVVTTIAVIWPPPQDMTKFLTLGWRHLSHVPGHNTPDDVGNETLFLPFTVLN